MWLFIVVAFAVTVEALALLASVMPESTTFPLPSMLAALPLTAGLALAALPLTVVVMAVTAAFSAAMVALALLMRAEMVPAFWSRALPGVAGNAAVES